MVFESVLMYCLLFDPTNWQLVTAYAPRELGVRFPGINGGGFIKPLGVSFLPLESTVFFTLTRFARPKATLARRGFRQPSFVQFIISPGHTAYRIGSRQVTKIFISV